MEKGYLYEVKLGLLISLTIPPEHPDLKPHLLENVADYLDMVMDGREASHYDANMIIDSYRLIEVRDL